MNASDLTGKSYLPYCGQFVRQRAVTEAGGDSETGSQIGGGLVQGQPADYAEVLKALRERDAQDMGRAVNPLRQAEDAILVDTTDMDFSQSVEAILTIIRERTGAKT